MLLMKKSKKALVELEALVEGLDKTCTRYKMEISAEKTKLMTNSARGRSRFKDRGLEQ